MRKQRKKRQNQPKKPVRFVKRKPSSARRLATCHLRLPGTSIPTGEVPVRAARAAPSNQAKYAVATTAAPVAAAL